MEHRRKHYVFKGDFDGPLQVMVYRHDGEVYEREETIIQLESMQDLAEWAAERTAEGSPKVDE